MKKKTKQDQLSSQKLRTIEYSLKDQAKHRGEKKDKFFSQKLIQLPSIILRLQDQAKQWKKGQFSS